MKAKVRWGECAVSRLGFHIESWLNGSMIQAYIGKYYYDCRSTIHKLVNPVTNKTLIGACDRPSNLRAMNAQRTHNGFTRIGCGVSGDISHLVVIYVECNDWLLNSGGDRAERNGRIRLPPLQLEHTAR